MARPLGTSRFSQLSPENQRLLPTHRQSPKPAPITPTLSSTQVLLNQLRPLQAPAFHFSPSHGHLLEGIWGLAGGGPTAPGGPAGISVGVPGRGRGAISPGGRKPCCTNSLTRFYGEPGHPFVF